MFEQDLPNFFELLSTKDQNLYKELKDNVGSFNNRYKRNLSFEELLKPIRQFCENDDSDSWKRYLVCGICWFDNFIAVNTRQLKFILSKSKSAINLSLANLNYTPIQLKGRECESLLFKKIPFLWENYSEYRKWSIRENKTKEIKHQQNDINLDDLFDLEKLFKDIQWDDDCCDKNKYEEENENHIDDNFGDFDFNYDSFADEAATIFFKYHFCCY